MSTDLPPRLASWLRDPDVEGFPYRAVVGEFQRVGKQRVRPQLLAALAEARTHAAGHPSLRRFLDVALDKYDDRYDYTSYLAIGLFPTPGDLVADRVVTQLVADVLAFELGALDGADVPLPRMRPDAEAVGKRCRHGLRCLAPFAARAGFPPAPQGGPLQAARAVTAEAERHRSAEEAQLLRTTMLPVDTLHDEYMFIRVLQCFEMLFAISAQRLDTVPALLDSGDVRAATAVLEGLSDRFEETAPLFSMLATMRVEAFQTFRLHTEGASAIQSHNYKRMESRCSRPDPGRLASAAYESVPAVRDDILTGRRTIDDAFAAFDPAPHDAALLARARERFAASYGRWRRTHYGLAVRMLGDKTGSGYTAGLPYLADVRDVPVFRT